MTRPFDVFPTPRSRGSGDALLICVLQSHNLEALNTVLVAPLVLATAGRTSTQPAVPITFDEVDYLLDTTLIANIECKALRRAVGSLLAH